jgi:phage repressor protein C with HTH and peptisase S24 domain
MSIGKRVMKLRVGAGLSRAKLAQLAKIAPSSVQRIEEDQQEPSAKVIMRIAGALGMKSTDILEASDRPESTQGLTLKEVVKEVVEEAKYKAARATEALDKVFEVVGSGGVVVGGAGDVHFYKPIPLISWALAVSGETFTEQGFPIGGTKVDIEWPADLKDPNAYALKPEDDSMLPRLMPGDLVVVSPAASYASGDICVVKNLEHELWIRKLLERKDHYVLQAVNPGFEPISLPKAEVSFIHKVVWIKPK